MLALSQENVFVHEISRIAVAFRYPDVFGHPIVALSPLHFESLLHIPTAKSRDTPNDRDLLAKLRLVIDSQSQ